MEAPRPLLAETQTHGGMGQAHIRERAYLKPRVTVITIGVEDLKRSLAFYRDGLGLETPGGEELDEDSRPSVSGA